MSNMGKCKPVRIRPPNSPGWHLVYSRSTRNSLYTNVTAILSTAESSCPILVCKYTSGTCPKPLHVLHGRCFWDWRGRRELWEVNEPNPGCLVQGSVECRSRTVPRVSTNSRCISRPHGPHARYAWDCKRQTTHDYLHGQSLS